MNTLVRLFRFPIAGALLGALTLTGFAQPATPAEKNPPPAQTPAATPPEAAPAPAPDAAPPAESREDRSDLRRLDQPGAPVEPQESPTRRYRGGGGTDFPFGDHYVSKESRIRVAVSIFGSTTVDGHVDSDAVSVLGNTTIGPDAKIGGAAVAVLGQLRTDGEVRDEVVSVLGRAEINGRVRGEAVCVLGNMHLGPKAVIDGDIVIVGGRLTRDPAAIVDGNQVNVPLLGSFGDLEWLSTWVRRCLFMGRPLAFGGNLGWAWAIAFSFFAFYLLLALLFPGGVVKCAETLERRPGASILAAVLTVFLTPVAVVLLAVTVVGTLLVPFLGAALFFAGLFGKAVMLAWIGRRFTRFFGDGLFGLPVFAVLIGGLAVLLLYTVPIVGFLTYKLLSWLGLGVVVFTIAIAMKRDKPAAAAGAAGGHSVPVAPFTPSPAAAPMPTATATMPMAAEPPAAVSAPVQPVIPSAVPPVSAGFVGAEVNPAPAPFPATEPASAGPVPPAAGESSASAATASYGLPPPATPPPPRAAMPGAAFGAQPVAPAVVWPRATLWIRLAALALDGILIGLIMAFISGILPRFLRIHDGPGGWLIALAIYGAVMWKHKGTTIGGIICGLKVVRVDNREVDWATAIVRALGCFLSMAVAGLGFIWIAIDDERQAWHDKVAGTAVVRVPKGVSLL